MVAPQLKVDALMSPIQSKDSQCCLDPSDSLPVLGPLQLSLLFVASCIPHCATLGKPLDLSVP